MMRGVMNGLMSPTSPEAYRKETSQVYASGWPPVFLGDLHDYLVEYDLREEASRIDTAKVGVHILSGEYDSSGPIDFPMSENPERFIEYLLPVLEKVQVHDRG